MREELLAIIAQLKKLPYVERTPVEDLEHFINSNTAYTRDENPDEHVCAFFLPVVLKDQLVFVGHHKKADDWIPPGGHIDKGEMPLQTVIREMQEELQYTILPDQIALFDCANKSIMKPGIPCKRHYDLAYVVFLENEVEFQYDPKEFHDARWMTFDQAAKAVQTKAFQPMMRHLHTLL